MAKLSLHESGRWRRALTSQEAARQNLPDNADRVLNRWEVPEPIAKRAEQIQDQGAFALVTGARDAS